MNIGELEIGMAVVPIDDPEHDVMTVYETVKGGAVAYCNWVVGTKMFRATHFAFNLKRVMRKTDRGYA